MIKYISSNKLNLAALIQIAGIALLIYGAHTPTRIIFAVVVFAYGAFLYRQTLHAIRDQQKAVQHRNEA